MDDSSDVLKKAIDKVGVKAVVNQLDVSQPYVYKWLQGKDGSGTRNPLDRIKTIVDITGDTTPIDWLCKSFGGTFVKDDPTGGEFELSQYFQYHADISNKLSNLNSAILGAIIGDQRVDQEEYEDIQSKWYETKQVVESFVQACEKWAKEYEEEKS